MKPPAGKPRARRPVQRKPVQLDLRRTPTWPEEDEAAEQPDSHFWRWFAVVLLVHLIVFAILLAVFHHRSPPPEQFISLLPPGEVVKGTPGPSTAPKVAPTAPAPSHSAPAAATPPSAHVTPPHPKAIEPPAPKPPPILTEHAKAPAPVKPKPKPKPVKVKVDLTLQDAPDTDEPTPAPAPKPKLHHHPKKPAKPVDDSANAAAAADSDTQGLSRDEVARKLGETLSASGVAHADKTGTDGSEHSKQNDFSDFYQAIHDQVMNKWSVPNFVDPTAVDPVVQIHVEKDGRVPPDLVTLKRSSNNPAFDQSALEAARAIGYTLQPLPDGCPPDISITFNLHQQ